MRSSPFLIPHRSHASRFHRGLLLGFGALLAASAALATTDLSTLTTGANTAVTLNQTTDTAWTVNSATTVGTLAYTHSNGTGFTLSGPGSTTLTFSNASTPTWTTSTYFSINDYVSNLAIASSGGLAFTGKSNALIFQSGVSTAGITGTFTIKSSTDGSILYAQGNDVLPANASFALEGGSGSNNYRYSKLVLNGGTTQTIGALSSTGVTANTYIATWNGNAGLLVGTSVSSGTNVLGSTSAATLRLGNDNASASFGGVIGSGYTTGGVLTTDSSTQAINLVKLGSGTQTLTGANTYTGSTTVSAGTLALTGTGSIANTYAVSVAAGAAVNVSGLTSPALNLATAPLTLGVGSATKGFLNIGSGTLTLGSTLTLNFESSTLSSSYDLYDAGTVSGAFSGVSVTGAIGTGVLTNSSGVWSGPVGAYLLSFNQSTGVLSISPSGAGTPPSAPASLTVTTGFEQVSLSWSAVADAVSYIVKRSTTSGSGYVTLASGLTGTTYTDTTATPGVTYYYVVVAVNVNGESDPSPSGSAASTVRAAIGLNIRAFNTYGLPVTDLSGVARKAWWNNLVGPAYAGDAATFASFTDALGNPVPGMSATFTAGTGATLKLGSDAVTVAPASNDLNLYSSVFDQYNGTASTLSVTGIPYASYDLVVYVYDGGSARGGTITANGATLAIRGGSGSPAADGTGYVRSTDAVNTSGSSVQQGNYVRFTGLSGNLTASFVATNMGDGTQRLKIAGFQILGNDANPAPSAAPATPAGLTASGGNRQIALNWNHTATATSYKVYRGGTFLATVTAPARAYADTTAANGTSYSYTVSAVNAVGESAQTGAVSTTPSAPSFTLSTRDVYQYSIPVTAIYSNRAADPMRRAYLWVPPGLTRLQGVMVGLHNMLEKPMFEDPVIRQACADAGLGIVFITPGDAKTWTPSGVGNYSAGPLTTALNLDPNNYGTTDTNPSTGQPFTSDSEQAASELAEILRRLGVESGYTELQYAPILLTGHSAASPFVWTEAVHTSSVLGSRVFAILPYKGFFPGSIPDGMPVLHVASEWQEISFWGNTWEVGDAPSARNLRGAGANRLLAEYVQPGTGHYDYSETQSGPIATFIKRAAQLRIPSNWTTTASPVLNTLAASSGYLVDFTTLGSGTAAPVAYADWISAGKDPLRAYWYLDQQTAQAACDAMNAGFSKKPQLISAFSNASTLPDLANQSNGAGTVSFSATLQGDGVTFQMRAASLNQSPIPKLFHGAPVGIPTGSILFKVNRSGALKQTGVDTFRVWLDRGSVIKTGQPWEPFVIAWHPGDANYRMADRPIALNTSVPVNLTSYSGGSTQTLTFTAIPNQSADSLPLITLDASSSAGTSYPAQFWMVSGPYRNQESDSATLLPDTVPAGSKFPMRVIVGAWQWGKPGVMQSATPVYRTFWIFKNSFQKWQFDQFGAYDTDGTPVTPAGSSDATADPDGDGLNNLLEYALGGNQAVPDSSTVSPVVSTASDHLQLTFNRIADPVLTYTVQATDNLASTWTDIWTSTGTDNLAGSVTVADTQLLSTSPRRFLRLMVTQ